MNHDNSGPTFPQLELNQVTGNICEQHLGITFRDYFAARAMQGMFANPELGESMNAIATAAYRAADAMMEARK